MRNKLIFLTLTAIILITSCRRTEAPEIRPAMADFILNTVCVIILYDRGEAHIYEEIFARIREIESRMSAFIEGSYIARINRAAGIEPVRVPPDVFFVVERAVQVAELSNGAFDPTVGPIVALWDIGGRNPRPGLPRIPSQEEIDKLLPLVNWRNVELNRENQTIFLTEPGMALDLGAIAKGYAADEAAAIIRNARIPQAIVDLGGNTLLVGLKADRTPWRVGVQTPFAERGVYLGVVETWETSVVTSGGYEQFIIYNGVHYYQYHHLICPTLGRPAQTGLISATIITGVSMDADAFSTAIFVLGHEKGMELVESMEGMEAIFILEDRRIFLSSGLAEGVDFILVNDDFRIAGN